MHLRPEELLGNVVALAIVGVALLVGIGIMVYVCYLIFEAQKALPPQHQKIQPGLVWLIMVPCLNVFWNFYVFTQVPASYQSYFGSTGEPYDTSLGALGIAYSVLALFGVIPYLGACLGLVALVVLIIFLVKLTEAKKRALLASPMGPAAVPSPFGYGP